MSEEIPETADGAVKAYLFAIGFTLVLIGGEMMAEKTQDRFWIGLALVILALPVHLGWVFWKLIKERVGPQLRDSLNRVATDARSWISLLLMVLLALIVSPLFGGLSTNVFIGAIVLWMAVAALITISPTIPIFARQSENIFYSPKVTAHLPTLQTALYVGEIRFTTGELEKDRHSELTIRVFNGSGSAVEMAGISGHIKFSAPNSADGAYMGELPTPSARPDMDKSVHPLREWFLILSQRVPAIEADKLLKMLETEVPIHLDLNGLAIEVFRNGEKNKTERLPLWWGVRVQREIGFGRIIGGSLIATGISVGLS